MYTIWGKAQTDQKIEQGVSWVSTASHGGLRVAVGVARKKLTPNALKVAEERGGYVYFEEDSAYAVACWECDEWRSALGASSREELLRLLSRWFPEYLRSVGVTPDPELESEFMKYREFYA